MSRSLATLVFIGFILWLFYRESKKASAVPMSLWVPTMWVALIASKPVGYWIKGRDNDEADLSAYLDGNPLNRNVFLAVILLGVIILITRRTDWRTLFAGSRWLWLFYFYLAISVLWSDYPLVAFKRWVRDLGNVIMILIILTERRPVEAFRQVFVRCAYVLVPLSVLFIKYYPEIGRYYHRWTHETCYAGVTTNKNSLGVLAMVSGLILVWCLVENHKPARLTSQLKAMLPEALVVAMCVWILQIADSATSLACFWLGVIAFIVYRFRWARARLRHLNWCTYSLMLLSALVLFVPELRKAVAESLGRDTTLTGRTDIWAAALNLKTNFLIGEGFASVWLTRKGYELAQEVGFPHVHNGYLETYLNSGLIGLGLLLAVLLSAGRNAAQHLRTGTPCGPVFMALFLSGVIYNYTEVTFNVSNVVGFILWLIAVRSPLAVDLKTSISTCGLDVSRTTTLGFRPGSVMADRKA